MHCVEKNNDVSATTLFEITPRHCFYTYPPCVKGIETVLTASQAKSSSYISVRRALVQQICNNSSNYIPRLQISCILFLSKHSGFHLSLASRIMQNQHSNEVYISVGYPFTVRRRVRKKRRVFYAIGTIFFLLLQRLRLLQRKRYPLEGI